MTFAIVLKLLHGVHYGDLSTLNMLRSTQIFVIPIVNVDGVAIIEENETGDGTIILKRKNGRFMKNCRRIEDQGVDLNRNYDVSWVSNLLSADKNPC